MATPSRRISQPVLRAIGLAALVILHSPQPGAAQTTSEVSLGNVTKETKLSFTGSFTILNPAPQITVTARVEIPNLADGLVVIA